MIYNQVDDDNVFVHKTQDFCMKPYRAVAVKLPALQPGETAKWITLLDCMDEAFGDEGTGNWEVLADYRAEPLYLTSDGSSYVLKSVLNGTSFDGLGVMPAWLTTTERPSKYHNWVGGAWVLDTTAQAAGEAADVLAAAVSKAATERAIADAAIAPLQDASDLGIATSTESSFLAQWKTYRVDISRVPQQSGYPATIDWPTQPAA